MDYVAKDPRLLNESTEEDEDDENESGAALAVEAAPAIDDASTRPDIPPILPVLPVRDLVVFPGTVVPLHVAREKSKRLIDAVLSTENKMLAIFTQRKADVEDPGINDVYRVGTAAVVLKLLRSADGTHNLLVHGVARVGLEEFTETEPYWKARIHAHIDATPKSLELAALAYSARRTAEQVIALSPNVPEEATVILNNIEQPGPLADFLAANLSLGVVQKQELLETFDVADRLRKVGATLQNQLEVLQLAQKIQSDTRGQIEKSQREYYLHEQLKAIQKELGVEEGRGADLADLQERMAKSGMPEPVAAEAKRELARLERLPQASAEYSVARDYLELLCELPWTKQTEDNLDLDRASAVLEADHYGLERIKRRILEFLAVRKLKPDGKGPILCFAGPPGVGKTSLGQSIARALNRKFIRIALGGVRDEADIRGHRRTYIGAFPGRIMQEIRKAGVRNPVIMLDELDKLAEDFRGDPSAALLEVLDPAQNHTFVDHYLSVPFDLSHVLFIATANYMDPVAPALRDRMEVIELSGYTLHEKLEIAKRYLVPRQLEDNGITNRSVQFDDTALRTIIERYTREAGVRNLERLIGTVARGLAAKVARNQPIDASIQPEDLEEYLGPARYDVEEAARVALPGVVTGLAYTPVGGDIIFVEATRMPGRGNFLLTGQIGDVMRESAQAALSLVRARAREWKISGQKLRESDIHIHVPAGGVPKDGPSAGVAMLTALVSVLSNRAADPGVAMTGEITLRGLVLPIGGVKEKVLAAHRAGIRTVVLPARNRPDLHEVPKDVQEDLQFVFAEKVEEVLAAALPGLRLRSRGAGERSRGGGRAAGKGLRAASGAVRRGRRRNA